MNTWRIAKALASYRSLLSILEELTEMEVLHVLEVEAGSRRRAVMLNKLIQKAAELNRNSYIRNLKEKYNGTNKKRSTVDS